jgi:hypothetical protein
MNQASFNIKTTNIALKLKKITKLIGPVSRWNKVKIECTTLDKENKMGETSIRVQITFFETDSILRSIHLPINYSNLHLLQFKNEALLLKKSVAINWNIKFILLKATLKVKKTKIFRKLQ